MKANLSIKELTKLLVDPTEILNKYSQIAIKFWGSVENQSFIKHLCDFQDNFKEVLTLESHRAIHQNL